MLSEFEPEAGGWTDGPTGRDSFEDELRRGTTSLEP